MCRKMALSRSKQDGKYHLELMAAKQQSMHEANSSRICYSANVQASAACHGCRCSARIALWQRAIDFYVGVVHAKSPPALW